MAPTTTLILLLAITGFCIVQAENERCPINDEEMEVFNKCAKEAKPDYDVDAMMSDPNYFSEEEMKIAGLCYAKEVNILTKSGEFLEEAAKEMIQQMDAADDVKEEILGALKECIKDKNSEENGEEIALCMFKESDKICYPDMHKK